MGLASDTLANWISQVAQYAISFIAGILIARILGPELTGLYTATTLANVLIVNTTSLGAQAAASYYFSDRKASFAHLHTLFLLMLLLILVFEIALGLAFGHFLREKVFGDLSDYMIFAALAALPFAIYQFIGFGILTGLGKLKTLAFYGFYTTLVPSIFNVIWVLSVRFGPWWSRPNAKDFMLKGLVWIWVGSLVFYAIYIGVLVGRGKKMLEWIPLRQMLRELGGMLRYGLSAFYGNLASTIVNRFDQFLMLPALGAAGFGIYSKGKSLALMLIVPSTALSRAGFSQVRAGAPHESARLVRELARANFLIVSPVILAMILFARPFIVFAYGPQWVGAAIVLQILLPGVVMAAMARMLALYFTAHEGRPHIPSNITWIAAILTFAMLWIFVFVFKWGMIGGALAAMLGNAAILCMLWLRFGRTTGLWNPLPFFMPKRSDWTHLMRVAGGMMRKSAKTKNFQNS